MQDAGRVERVLRELHEDRARRQIRWELSKMVVNALIVIGLVITLWVLMDRRMAQQEDSLVDLWHRVDAISEASADH